MKVMLAQIENRVGDIEANVRQVLEVQKHAEAQHCDLVVFPELNVTGYPPEDLLFRESFLAQADAAVQAIAMASGETCLVFGAPRRRGSQLMNSAFLVRHGRVVGVYDKQELPNYGVFDERRYFTPGDGRRCVFEVGDWRVGIGICEDLWSDELAARQSGQVCDVWLNLNASPFHVGKQDEREILIRRRARQLHAPVVYVNPVGGQDEVVFDGGSHVMGTEGEMLARMPLFQTGLCTVNLAAHGGELARMPADIEQIHQALVLGVRDYVRRNGCKQVVIGLSGGIDSALTAVIAVEALGAENVLGVLLPSQYSSDHSLTDARALAKNLNIDTVTLPIADAVQAVEGTLSPVFSQWDKATPDVTEENIQARIRGVLLMAVSNKTGRMLLTTGNKSEMAVGYATLYGDMAGGFAVIKDVYKTQVYALSEYLNREKELIPLNTIRKPPSAELRPDQKDSDSLPDYAVLDAILESTIEQRLSVEEIVAQGYQESEVRRVVRMVQVSEYKRRQAPPGVKITRRAFGRDRRYPMTHGFVES